MTIQEFSAAVEQQVSKVILGKKTQIRLITAAILSNGHVLLEDLPGSGKTTLVKAFSAAVGCEYKRIQFVPDLLPSDILGAKIFNQKSGDFEYLQGPVKTNILLADELNRAIPRTQAALLEAMEERQITIDGVPEKLPQPFLVLATQNPVEMESTFPLPAAQLDRFFCCLSLGYPDFQTEMDLLDSHSSGDALADLTEVAGTDDILRFQQEVTAVKVSPYVKEYIVKLVQSTRKSHLLKAGASPRASLCLFRGAQAWAAMEGRDFVLPDDVQFLAPYIMGHRLILSSEARFSGKNTDAVLGELIASVAVPPTGEEYFFEKKG